MNKSRLRLAWGSNKFVTYRNVSTMLAVCKAEKRNINIMANKNKSQKIQTKAPYNFVQGQVSGSEILLWQEADKDGIYMVRITTALGFRFGELLARERYLRLKRFIEAAIDLDVNGLNSRYAYKLLNF